MADRDADHRSIERELHIDAAPATVFAHLTDPDRLVRWLGARAELDPRPGGRFRVEIGDGITAAGTFVRAEPNHQVVFTWGWEEDWSPLPPGATTVEVTLHAEGDGTRLRLRHLGLPPGDVAFHRRGWTTYLPRLAAASVGDDPGPDPIVELRRVFASDEKP